MYLIKKICEYCATEFESHPGKHRKFCSKQCSGKYISEKIDIRLKRSNDAIERWSNSEFREKMNIINSSAETKMLKSKGSKEAWNKLGKKEDWSKFQKELQNTPEHKEKLAIKSKAYWGKEENRIAQSERQKEIQNRPDVRAIHSLKSKEINNNPRVREAASARMLKCWQDLEFAEKRLKANFKYKEYIMPSGKIVKVQGYEPQVLDELIKLHSESDIFVGTKTIGNEIGKIKYVWTDNKKHNYYPDIYIKSEHKIIEVKSQYYFDKHKIRNLLKMQACLNAGFNFEFKIL